MLLDMAMDCRSSDVPDGVSVSALPSASLASPKAEGVRLCFVRYDEDRGRPALVGRGSEFLRGALGDPGGEGEAEALEGGM